MPTKRQLQFLDKVAEAAREAPLPPGRPTPANLTEDGRKKGLQALRCRSNTKSSSRCKNPAMRGATRCIKHGGRVEVPNHPHNVRRFMTGKIRAYYEEQDRYLEGKAAWETMSWQQQTELLEALPNIAKQETQTLYAAALVWRLSDVLTFNAWHARWQAVVTS